MMKRFLLFASLCLAALAAGAQNPYLPLWEHLPDGEPRVFEDPDHPGKYRAYIIGSHDITYTAYCGSDIRMWSAPVEDLTQWRDEGPIFTWFVDGQWDTMYAPDLVEVQDKATGKKTYYLYPHSRGRGRVAMVCKGDRPDGPFFPVNATPDGRGCLPGSIIDFDPSVFVEYVTDKKDPDFARGYRAYAFYGFQHSTAIELDPDTMYSLRPGTQVHDYFIPASSRYGVVRDPEGTQYPSLYQGQNPGEFNFFEASSIRQVGNKYVMVFSGYSGPDYGLESTNSALRYAYGDSPLGPWRSGGVLVERRAPDDRQRRPQHPRFPAGNQRAVVCLLPPSSARIRQRPPGHGRPRQDRMGQEKGGRRRPGPHHRLRPLCQGRDLGGSRFRRPDLHRSGSHQRRVPDLRPAAVRVLFRRLRLLYDRPELDAGHA